MARKDEKSVDVESYERYYLASLSGVVASSGLEHGGFQHLDELAHRMALTSLRSRDKRLSRLREGEGEE